MRRRILLLTVLFVLSVSAPLHAEDADAKAVQAIEKAGGRVFRDNKQKGKPVISVVLAFSNATDETVKVLGGCKQLRAAHPWALRSGDRRGREGIGRMSTTPGA